MPNKMKPLDVNLRKGKDSLQLEEKKEKKSTIKFSLQYQFDMKFKSQMSPHSQEFLNSFRNCGSTVYATFQAGEL